jgi:hypothetical protein
MCDGLFNYLIPAICYYVDVVLHVMASFDTIMRNVSDFMHQIV